MNKPKWIIQTFWTKPMSKEMLKDSIVIAKISLYYAHRSGYFVKMYTDTTGYRFLKGLGYDKIVKDLDSIPDNISGEYFAFSKYVALRNEPIGAIHTDFDVFLKKPCLDEFYDNKKYDIILQHREAKEQMGDPCYVDGFKFFDNKPKPKGFNPAHRRACNVGVIGFNSIEARDAYLNLYRDCVDFYRKNYRGFGFLPDLFFEQVNIDYLIEKNKYKVFFLLPEYSYGDLRLHERAKEIGYQHLIGWWKRTDEGKNHMKKFINDVLSFQKSDVNKIWACSQSGKSYLCEKNEKYVDFDVIKEENNLIESGCTEYTIELFKLFNNTCLKYNRSGKTIIFSDIELLHSFAKEFSEIYVLTKDEYLKRSNNDADTLDLIEYQLDVLKPHKLLHMIDDYLSNHLK